MARQNTVLGSADCILCDAAKVFDVTRHVLAPEPECLVTRERIEKERVGGLYIILRLADVFHAAAAASKQQFSFQFNANHFFMSAADSVEQDK